MPRATTKPQAINDANSTTSSSCKKYVRTWYSAPPIIGLAQKAYVSHPGRCLHDLVDLIGCSASALEAAQTSTSLADRKGLPTDSFRPLLMRAFLVETERASPLPHSDRS